MGAKGLLPVRPIAPMGRSYKAGQWRDWKGQARPSHYAQRRVRQMG